MAKRSEKLNPSIVAHDVPSIDASDDEVIAMMR